MKRLLLLLILFVFSISVFSQKKEITVKEYFADAEYFLIQEEYQDALHDYLQVYSKGFENNANINYHIGICYINIPGQKEKSIEYFEKSVANASKKYRESTLNEVYAPLDAYLYLGNAYRINYELDTAVKCYNKYLEVNTDQSEDEKVYVEKQIEACYIAKEFVMSPKKVEFVNFGSLINSSSSNYNAVISGDGSTMVYMNKLPFYEAIYMSKRRGDNWSRPINITPHLMSDGDQIVTGISYDGKTLLVAKSDVFNSDIYISRFVDGQWSKSKPISKNINTKYWESHASFSSDGKTIYFTSNKKGGIGAMDIYKSVLDEDGNWGAAKNLGNGINTPLNEDTPFVNDDGTKLFYSSQGHRNIGGYDYFYSEYVDTAWTYPQNLQYPLSTTDEDLFYYPIANGEKAITHRILEDGYGMFDIYEVSFPTEVEMEETIAEQIAVDVEEELEQTQMDVEVPKTELVIKPILFAFDKAVLSTDAKRQIAQLIQVLNSDSDITIRIIGYTDALGPENYNMLLSKRRANEVANYFISEGISKTRVDIIGKGEMDFVASNKTSSGADNPEGRKYNRRVEFELIGIDEEFFIIKKVNIVPEHLQLNKK